MDSITISSYNQKASHYDDQTKDFWERFPRTFFDAFIERAGKKVLDVGSGPGRDGLILKKSGLEVTCLDASETMVQMCKEKGLEAVHSDFMHMPFANKTFDSAWTYCALLHVPKSDLPLALSEIKRVLKNNGILGLGLIEGDSEGYAQRSTLQDMPRWFSFYQKAELLKIFTSQGFTLLYFDTFQPSGKNYLHFLLQNN